MVYNWKYFKYLMVWSVYTKREIIWNWWSIKMWSKQYPQFKSKKCKYCETKDVPRLDLYIAELCGNVYYMEILPDKNDVWRCKEDIISKQEKDHVHFTLW